MNALKFAIDNLFLESFLAIDIILNQNNLF